MNLLAIDPGPTHTGWVIIEHATRRPIAHGKDPNDTVLDLVRHGTIHDAVVIEQVKSYGMTVSDSIFETCVWTGRFIEAAAGQPFPPPVHRLPRLDVKLHHCHAANAKDGNIAQALADRFAPGRPNRGKGTKAAPGWFYGFSADVWQAYALGVCWIDQNLPAGDGFGTVPMEL